MTGQPHSVCVLTEETEAEDQIQVIKRIFQKASIESGAQLMEDRPLADALEMALWHSLPKRVGRLQ